MSSNYERDKNEEIEYKFERNHVDLVEKLKKVIDKNEVVEYKFEKDHVNLFIDLQEQSDKPNKEKNKILKTFLGLLIVYISIYILVLGERFKWDLGNTKFRDNIHVFGESLIRLLDNNFIKLYVNSRFNLANYFNEKYPEIFHYVASKIEYNLNYIIFILLLLLIKVLYELFTEKMRLQTLNYLKIITEDFLELITKRKKLIKINSKFNIERYISLDYISIDYSSAKMHKEALLSLDCPPSIEEKNKLNGWYAYVDPKTEKNLISSYNWGLIRIRRKFLIEINNWRNVTFSTKIFIFALLLNLMDFIEISEYMEGRGVYVVYFKEFILLILLAFVLIRIASRGVEIAISFFTDVVKINSKMFYKYKKGEFEKKIYINKYNSSLLRTNARLSLAIHTLIELIILFAVAYWLLLVLFSDSSSYITLVESLLFSFSVSAFNFSFMTYDFMMFTFLHVAQVSMSVILILISIAQYISGETLTFEEQMFYSDVKETENAKNNQEG